MDLKLNGNFCSGCGSEVKYNNRYDAYYCELCNQWLEVKCNDPECEYCPERPNKPSQCVSDVG